MPLQSGLDLRGQHVHQFLSLAVARPLVGVGPPLLLHQPLLHPYPGAFFLQPLLQPCLPQLLPLQSTARPESDLQRDFHRHFALRLPAAHPRQEIQHHHHYLRELVHLSIVPFSHPEIWGRSCGGISPHPLMESYRDDPRGPRAVHRCGCPLLLQKTHKDNGFRGRCALQSLCQLIWNRGRSGAEATGDLADRGGNPWQKVEILL